MAMRTDAPVAAAERDALARALHRLKNGFYADLVREGSIPLRPGVAGLVQEAASRGLVQALVTTTSRANVDALLGRHFGAQWHDIFAVAVCGEDVAAKKPDPEAYLKALAALSLGPLSTLAIEDSPPGAAAARTADVPVAVTRSVYFAHDAIDGAVAIGPGLHTRRGWLPASPGGPAGQDDGPVTLDLLADWHARMDLVSRFG